MTQQNSLSALMPARSTCWAVWSATAIALAFAVMPAAAKAAAHCDTLYASQLPMALALDYQQFDQTPGQGFRVLAEAGCPSQAADLIEVWIAHTGDTRSRPRWHVAQLRGEAAEIDAATAMHAGNGINADFLRRLQPHFSLGYAAALTAE